MRRSELLAATFEDLRTSSSTKIGQSTRRASAKASEGRESMLMMRPSRSTQMTAKERVVAQFGDYDFADLRFQADQDVLDEVVRHGPRGGDFLDLQRDGVGLVDADPDGQNGVAADVLENHDGHVGDRVHHEPANFHFYFHREPWGSCVGHNVRSADCPLYHHFSEQTVGKTSGNQHAIRSCR